MQSHKRTKPLLCARHQGKNEDEEAGGRQRQGKTSNGSKGVCVSTAVSTSVCSEPNAGSHTTRDQYIVTK